MKFAGPAFRLQAGQIGTIAKANNIETAVLLAVVEVEAAGSGFDAQNRPKILPERHRMWVELGAGAKRDRAAALDLAYPRWGTLPYPRTSNAAYALLERMAAIDEEAAYRSTSWGLPQILGSNFAAAGFRSASAMIAAFMVSEFDQLTAMMALIKDWGIDRHLRGRDFSTSDAWRPFAQRYNGQSYDKPGHEYHKRLATAYRKHKGKTDMVAITGPTILAKGMRGEEVRALQADLIDLGFDPNGIDGRFGDGTDKAVRAFQASAGLTADGRVGDKTREAIKLAKAKTPDTPIAPPAIWPGQEDGEAARDFAAERAAALVKLEAVVAELRAIDEAQKEAGH